MSPRARVAAIVALIAVAAAGATVGGALVQGREAGGEVHGRTETGSDRAEPPALELAAVSRDATARALGRAERVYEEGNAASAAEQFEAILRREPDSVEAAVGAAVAAWPIETRERLEELVERHPDSAVARLNLGLVLFAEGEAEAAREEWREAERRDPDAPAALRAEDLLNADSPPGRPVFVAPIQIGDTFAAALLSGDDAPYRAARARAAAGDPSGWLRIGVGFQQLGKRVSAEEAFDEAVRAAPGSLEARVAAAVARFDKDDPTASFSRLGPLAGRHPRSGLVRFHLGLMLLWLPNVEESRRQLRLARAAGGFYGRQAARILARLDESE